MTTEADFRPSHVVPREGMATWSAPDGARPSVPLDPLLPVQVVDRRGDWALALCSNGWSAWVDGRLLVSVPRHPPAPGRPAVREADPRPLLERVAGELAEYRRLVAELAAGRLDSGAFRQRTEGRRVGVVVDGESVWLYDAHHERWCYCDGTSLQTFATPQGPVRDGPSPPSSPPPQAPGRAPPHGPGATDTVPEAGAGPADDSFDESAERTRIVEPEARDAPGHRRTRWGDGR
ncbi:hypothetical protein ACFYYR_01780 [Streptomyces sp. NPDC001922]|uniref:hypothetical protein n=1 Tax=Streptomyces sp. NPDC001922 TaxID=3364624 RepID=UPI00369EEA7F